MMASKKQGLLNIQQGVGTCSNCSDNNILEQGYSLGGNRGVEPTWLHHHKCAKENRFQDDGVTSILVRRCTEDFYNFTDKLTSLEILCLCHARGFSLEMPISLLVMQNSGRFLSLTYKKKKNQSYVTIWSMTTKWTGETNFFFFFQTFLLLRKDESEQYKQSPANHVHLVSFR